MYRIGTRVSTPDGLGTVVALRRDYLQVRLEDGGLEWYPALCVLPVLAPPVLAGGFQGAIYGR